MFSEVITLFSTGTGNSLKIATWAIEVAANKGLSTCINQIKVQTKWDFTPNQRQIFIFCYPTHGFTAPWLMIKQLLRLPKGNGASAAFMPSRAGIRIQSVSLPGMEGTAGYLLALILFFKGYKVRGVLGIDMPSNWTAVHWGISDVNANFIVSAAQPKVKHFVKTILAGEKSFDGIVPLALGLWLIPISFMYLAMAQFILAKLFFASSECIKCGTCQKLCPKNAIKLKYGRPYWTYSCDSCMACMNYCPKRAIEVSPVFTLLIYYLTSVSASSYLLNHFMLSTVSVPPNIAGVVQYTYVLVSVFLAYWFLHTALGISAFNWLLTKLSHTHYFRRYRAPGVTNLSTQK